MLSLEAFNKNISSLLYFAEVPVDEVKNKFLYSLLKNDFEDKMFGEICVDICKKEELYGKYPSPKMFYSRKEAEEKTELIEEGAFFIDDSIPEYKEALIGMSDDDMERCWRWIYSNRRGDIMSKQEIVSIIKKFNNHNLQPAQEYPTLTEIKKLISEHKEKK